MAEPSNIELVERGYEAWKRIKVIPERVVERGDEILVLLRFEGTGRAGIETSMRFINMIEVRDDLAYRFGAQPFSEVTVRELGLD